MKRYAFLLAAGRSSRMQLAKTGVRSKALLPIANSTVLERSLEALVSSSHFDRALVVVPPDLRDDFDQALAHLSVPAEHQVVLIEGGTSRQGSVWNALQAIERDVEASDMVLVHDAARCFVKPALVEKVLAEAERFGAATLATRCVDTVSEGDSKQNLLRTLDRNVLWTIQTPQVFRYELLRKGHDLAREQGLAEATDDASLVHEIAAVKLVEGDSGNIKITTGDDYTIACLLAASSQEASA